jgi:tetratricopeptide (TPR) repeat protein
MRHPLVIALVVTSLSASSLSSQSPAPVHSGDDSSRASILERAELAYAARRWNEAAQLYQSGLTDDRSPAHRWELAEALFNAGRHREAVAAFEQALQFGAGETAEASWKIARAYAHQGNWKQALRWLGHAVEAGFDADDAAAREPLFQQFRGDPRFIALTDGASASRRSACRLAAWTRRARVGEVDAAQLAVARPLHSREQAVAASAPVDDTLREVVGEILEAHLIADGPDGAEFRRGLPRGCRREDQGVTTRMDARVLELDD